MDELVRWLGEQLDKDTTLAKRAANMKLDLPSDAPWERARLLIEQGRAAADEQHIAEHDPARVLREIDAKRAIVDDLAEFIRWGARKGLDYQDGVDACERTLKRLALPYSDRPGYLEKWRP